MLARSRASDAIDVTDFLGAMYLADWDHLAQFWQESDQDRAERFLRRICNLSPQRWHTWIQTYERLRSDARKQSWNPLRKAPKYPAVNPTLRNSSALTAVLNHAEDIAPFADIVGDRRVPILTTECVFLCIAKVRGSQLGRGLAATGLNISELEQEVFFPKRAPLV